MNFAAYGLLDMSTALGALASFGGMSWALNGLRTLFLDALLARLNAAQKDIVLRIVYYALNYGFILGFASFFHTPMSASLLVSCGVAAAMAFAGGHLMFTGLTNAAKSKASTPDGSSVQSSPFVEPSAPIVSPSSAPASS